MTSPLLNLDMKLLCRAGNRAAMVPVALAVAVSVIAVLLPADAGIREVVQMVLAAVAASLLVKAWQLLRFRQSRLGKLLENHPDQVVWVYHRVLIRKPFGIYFGTQVMVQFHTAGKKWYQAPVGSGEVALVLDSLRERLPHATFGHSGEKEARYDADPNSLRVPSRG